MDTLNSLYQIGIPIENLSSVAMLWASYERPCKFLVSPAKTEDWAVVELRNTELAAEIIKLLPDSKVKIVNEPVKIVKL